MKKLINFILIAIAGLAVACHKDAALTKLAPVGFSSSLTASTGQVILSKSVDSTTVLTFNWPAVVYPVKAHVTYTLQADVPADTLGATAWANDTTITVGSDILTKSLLGTNLNKIALKYIAAGDTGKLVFRIQAYQDRNAYSKAVTITVSPYVAQIVVIVPPPPASLGLPVCYLPGFYQGWSPGTAGTVAAEQPGIYEGYIYMPVSSDPSAYHFKFTSAADWNHTNYGAGATPGTISTDGLAGDLVLPGPGFYEVVLNTNTLTWTYTAVTFGIIGDATPGGWTTDTPMTYDPVNHVWRVTAKMLTAGSFKFRANDAWNIDFGVDANNHLYYADNPAYPYNGSLNNLTVPADGTYIISLDVHDPNAYYYYIQKL